MSSFNCEDICLGLFKIKISQTTKEDKDSSERVLISTSPQRFLSIYKPDVPFQKQKFKSLSKNKNRTMKYFNLLSILFALINSQVSDSIKVLADFYGSFHVHACP